jgi:hypothetical protein
MLCRVVDVRIKNRESKLKTLNPPYKSLGVLPTPHQGDQTSDSFSLLQELKPAAMKWN